MAFGELKESEPVGRPAKGRRKKVLGSCVLHPLLASFSVHPELHSKLGSEVTKFVLKAIQKRCRKMETWILNSSFILLVGRTLENNH